MRPTPWLVMVLVGALAGLAFSAVSTYDFVQHLDRQVHNIHCSFIPGMAPEPGGSQGCQVAMMSPYSSLLRGTVWGGIPISLPAMSVFAFLFFFALDLALSKRQDDTRRTGFLVLATLVPVGASLVMGYIAAAELGTACKSCVGIYISSAFCLIGALVAWRTAARWKDMRVETGVPDTDRPTTATSFGLLAAAFVVGVVFVAAPVALYAAIAPAHEKYVGTCGSLTVVDDPYAVMVPLGQPGPGAAPAIEILDPLCPACRAFEQQLGDSGLGTRLARRAVLFPLDSTCNWMVDEAIHPGACVVSEAVLCAGDRADEVIAWAFQEQDRIREATAKDAGAAARIVKKRFPDLAACVGSPTAKSRLNKSLRWAVQNSIPVMTPQLYVDGVKLCDEDVDLGLVYSLGHMLDRHQRGELARPAPAAPVAAPVPPPAHAPAKPPAPAPAPEAAPASAPDPAPAPAPEAAPPPAPEAAPAPPPDPAPAPAPDPAPAPAEPPPAAPEGGTP